jgi:hypothetical protein
MACFKKATVHLEDGSKIVTDINKSLSDKEIRETYMKRKYIDTGFGFDKNGNEQENKRLKIKKVSVSKTLSCY